MYYPKSQIKTGLKTKGGELQDEKTGVEYVGDYFETSTGEYFSGKNPQDFPVVKLIPISNLTSIKPPKETIVEFTTKPKEPSSYNVYDPSYLTAKKLDQNPQAPKYPKQTTPKPKSSDYEFGEFERYFVCKTNGDKVIEITKDEFTKYKSQDKTVAFQLFTPLKISWVLNSDRNKMYSVNEYSVTRAGKENKLPSFKSYFKGRFDQFYKEGGL